MLSFVLQFFFTISSIKVSNKKVSFILYSGGGTNINGSKKINELYIQNVYSVISPNVIDDYLYVVYKYCNDNTCADTGNYIKKYDKDLKEVASYDMGWDSYEMVDVLATSISALCDKSETGWVDGLSCEYYRDNYNSNYYDYYDFYQITSDGESIIIYNNIMILTITR